MRPSDWLDTALKGIGAAVFAVVLLALGAIVELDARLATRLLVVAVAVLALGVLVWAARIFWAYQSADVPRYPRRHFWLVEGPEVLHRPESRESPWWCICTFRAKRRVSELRLKVTASEAAQVISARMVREKQLQQVFLEAPLGGLEPHMSRCFPEARRRSKSVRAAVMDFPTAPLDVNDQLTVVAQGNSSNIRIERVQLQRPPRK